MPSKTNTIDDLAARIPDAIARLRTLARHTLQTDLSEDYAAFLGRNDGLDFNGHVIYGATNTRNRSCRGLSRRTIALAGHKPARWTGRREMSLRRSPAAAMLTKVLRDAVEE
jgi:hypothetical protein